MSRYYHIHANPGQVVCRLDIDELASPTSPDPAVRARNARILNIYLLALKSIQEMDQNELTSFFQIGGTLIDCPLSVDCE